MTENAASGTTPPSSLFNSETDFKNLPLTSENLGGGGGVASAAGVQIWFFFSSLLKSRGGDKRKAAMSVLCVPNFKHSCDSGAQRSVIPITKQSTSASYKAYVAF